ncbi:MAG: bifunctional UDP-N-acetylmuramoyl-tripeptide:D-alanyl-D-alanine ligase/alanine racemase [Candidatus Amulumruptor caecigallinarius]|nr:bifunctional UDP-N-acetylmuramoyl-tripeptide:D-alanyl-D-alanine ligase/alanine racemase [Candidatus Amulumruptor caecigallinarius]MCM1397314.1 bifunctional UDP-N-acetylmuramoyl-tripeptide:D-alanyl-D-alanine ligase/alanine racemase [Candidatus Amulumruptor caecigallinarius]MCM1453621.1 bifunctional UDP-N-acetylmuramoyl-tripeptide:D-alanyl-D-alanine ligase/alanine racemase [bacterium]
MTYTISDIARIINPVNAMLVSPEAKVRYLLTDSRSLSYPEESLFFALVTRDRDGHAFIPALYSAGVRNFVVSEFAEELPEECADANFLVVNDTTDALRKLAGYHRGRFDIPIVGITGSRGKTTVKEWINQLLHTDETVLRSPRSFNSRIGLPLSLWELDPSVTLGLFEAGISRKGEMQPQAETLRPTVCIITNVGHEHDEGFSSMAEKASEKALLAADADAVIFCADDANIAEALMRIPLRGSLLPWSRKDPEARLYIKTEVDLGDMTEIEYVYDGNTYVTTVPFTAKGDMENAITTLAFLLLYGMPPEVIAARMSQLQPVDTRLRIIDGVNDCMLMLDGYTSDLHSLAPALDFMCRTRTNNRTLTAVLADFCHENSDPATLYREAAELLKVRKIDRIIGVGPEITANSKYFSQVNARFFTTVEEMMDAVSTSDFDHELILIKGSPAIDLTPLATRLEARQHETVLEVNLDTMMANYNFFRSFLKPSTGIVAMVKASGYGAGSYELAKTLQSAGAAYLAVASHDEGADLRSAGITMPIMVLNPKVVNYPSMFFNRLEPEIYSFAMLEEIIKEAEKCGVTGYPIHIKIDSGMHRLGFLKEEIPALCAMLVGQEAVVPRSVFSHLCAADDPADDDYTRMQFAYFDECCDRLQEAYPEQKILRHILNSTGIVRFPEQQHDMVRLGIGLYGIATMHDGSMDALRPVSSLHSVIISIREWPESTTIGYNRRGKLTRRSRIATIPIGYADGVDRHLGNGHSCMSVGGHRCPTVGNICMDVCMIDVTDVPECKVGDRVEVFGEDIPAAELATILGTIPYEILTSVASRVKRVCFRE